MQQLIKWCARGALGLGAAALLLGGVPAQAGPAAGESLLAPADASRDRQPLRLAQSKTQPEAAGKPEQRALQKQQQQNIDKLQREEKSGMQQPRNRKMRRMERSAPAPREAAPAKPGTSRFGAGVIRNKESDGD